MSKKEERISFDEYMTRMFSVQSRISVIQELFDEADEAIRLLDTDSLTEDQNDDAWDIAHDVARDFNANVDDLGAGGGLWVPSTC